MKILKPIYVLVLLVLAFSCTANHPATFENLARAYSQAHKAKSIQQVDELIYWGSMPKTDKERILGNIKGSFTAVLESIEIVELPADFSMTGGSYIYPFTPQKTMQVKYKKNDEGKSAIVGMDFTVGIKDGKAYILYRSEDVK